LVSAWPMSFLVDGLVVVVSRFAGAIVVNAETMPVVNISAAAIIAFFMIAFD
jgi:hypothetical protein